MLHHQLYLPLEVVSILDLQQLSVRQHVLLGHSDALGGS